METLPEKFNDFVSPLGGHVRVVMLGDEPWFIAKDVCDCLGLENVGQAVSYLDEDEKGTLDSNIITNDVGLNGGRAPLILSEPGLYSLILKSRKEEAKAFKRWVTHEVIPAIRKTGMYGGPKTLQESLRAYADLLDVNERNARLALEAKKRIEELTDNILSTEAQRDKAIREKAWINSSRSGKCMRKVRTANEEKRKVEAENGELKFHIGELEIRLGEAESWKTVAAMDKELRKIFRMDTRCRQIVGRSLASISRQLGLETKKAADSRFGEVNSYHVDAWKEFFKYLFRVENAEFMAAWRRD